MKTALAVIAGYVLWSVLWLGGWQLALSASPGSFAEDGSTDSTGILLAFLGLSVVLSILAGWTAGRIAASRTAVHVLGALLLASGIFFQAQSWSLMPLWFHLPFLALLWPATVIGGRGAGR